MHFVQSDAGASSGVSDRVPADSERPNHNLPASLTRFIGRERELAGCLELLDHSRLVTLTGVAGCGKTRLALQLAAGQLESHAGGVWFVNLAPLNDPGRVAQTLARTLDVREERGRTLTESIAAHIATQAMLIVLDNCEHVLRTSAETALELLTRCPNLRMITTSREALGVSGEAIFQVPSLTLPDPAAPDARAMESEAVRLFVDCATLARPDFRLAGANVPIISRICLRLDGIPFAIELAAARTQGLGARGAAGQARRSVPPPDRRQQVGLAPASDAAGHAGLELRPPDRRGARAPALPGRVRGGMEHRGGPAGGPAHRRCLT